MLLPLFVSQRGLLKEKTHALSQVGTEESEGSFQCGHLSGFPTRREVRSIHKSLFPFGWMSQNWNSAKTLMGSSSGPNNWLRQFGELFLKLVRLTCLDWTCPVLTLLRPPNSWLTWALFLGMHVVISRTDCQHDITVNYLQLTLFSNCFIHSVLPRIRRLPVNCGSRVTRCYPPLHTRRVPPVHRASASVLVFDLQLGELRRYRPSKQNKAKQNTHTEK